MKVGFIGLGTMGAPMATNIARAGFPLTVHDLDRKKARSFRALGARWANSPRQCAAGADAVITSLPGPPEVEAVLTGAAGVLAGLRAGATWIDMSTNNPEVLKRLAEKAAAKGANALDAPVTGAVDGAIRGTLTIFVGGEKKVLKAHRPLLRAMGKKIVHTGPLGTGQAVKLVTNFLWFVNATAIGEALVLGVRAGVDPLLLWKAIKLSAGRSWVAEHDVPSIFAGHYDPSFTLDLCLKDLGLIRSLGRSLDVPLEVAALVERTFGRARKKYGGRMGELHVVKLLEDATGTSLEVPGDWPAPWEERPPARS